MKSGIEIQTCRCLLDNSAGLLKLLRPLNSTSKGFKSKLRKNCQVFVMNCCIWCSWSGRFSWLSLGINALLMRPFSSWLFLSLLPRAVPKSSNIKVDYNSTILKISEPILLKINKIYKAYAMPFLKIQTPALVWLLMERVVKEHRYKVLVGPQALE